MMRKSMALISRFVVLLQLEFRVSDVLVLVGSLQAP
jgi:hypothetical protein